MENPELEGTPGTMDQPLALQGKKLSFPDLQAKPPCTAPALSVPAHQREKLDPLIILQFRKPPVLLKTPKYFPWQLQEGLLSTCWGHQP